MKIWQVSWKEETGGPMQVKEFPNQWKLLSWLAANIKSVKVAVICWYEE